MKKISTTQILRYVVLTAFLVIVTVVAYRHQLFGSGPGGAASIHAICPFGGLETLYQYIAGGTYLKRTFVSNFILLAGTIVLVILFGRFFCGWICMFGWIQELPARLGQWLFKKRFTVPSTIDKPLRYVKYVILIASIYFTWKLADLVISPYDPFAAYAHIPAGLGDMFDEYFIGSIILFVTIISSFFYDRVFCKYLCPLGAFLGIIYKVTNYKIKRDEETCIHCNKCTKACPVNIDVAKLESVTSAECINCLECVTVCPTKKETLKPYAWGKYLKPLTVGIVGVVIYVGIIAGTNFAGIWKTTEGSLVEMVTKEGKLDPYSIRGSMTMEQIATTFNIDINILYKELGISLEKIPGSTKMKEVKDIEKRLEENSVRDAVAKIKGLSQPRSPETKETSPVTKEKGPDVRTLPGTSGATPEASPDQKETIYTEETVSGLFEGKGIGGKTLAQVVKENNIDMEFIKKRLAAKNFTAKEEETIKEIAGRYNTTPIEFMKQLLVGGLSGK